MNREEFIKKIDSKIKLIRNERNYTQDKMAEIIGISKKTLIQIEKERGSLGWTGAVAVCSIFKDSEILQMTLGGDAQDIILSLAFDKYEENYTITMGGKIWWDEILAKGEYRVQKNIISNHYRILNKGDRRICYSFDSEYINKRLDELYSKDEEK
ncbi:helix-turn-helix domain-containing protein [Clostridium aestuarii]|uniref:Helix-turn-helix domain-containing protein n=1 Tax=Clostridium aestuarii TaxID=338193 RepID=A0ABT4D3P4_9CLOT|nr:helix-turn-helix domain-containing protein [Clostridium aestuarii]MCY6485757.1 helix-turn-helix domain-containing protein [Clostridium aestuarii]